MRFLPIAFILFISQICAQPDVDGIHHSLKKNELQFLCSGFDDYVEMDLPLSQGKYDKLKACTQIAQFLSDESVERVISLHTGTARDKGSFYSIGKIMTNKKEYRLYIYYRKKETSYLIKEIRIES